MWASGLLRPRSAPPLPCHLLSRKERTTTPCVGRLALEDCTVGTHLACCVLGILLGIHLGGVSNIPQCLCLRVLFVKLDLRVDQGGLGCSGTGKSQHENAARNRHKNSIMRSVEGRCQKEAPLAPRHTVAATVNACPTEKLTYASPKRSGIRWLYSGTHEQYPCRQQLSEAGPACPNHPAPARVTIPLCTCLTTP